jgi:hypothetical protein
MNVATMATATFDSMSWEIIGHGSSKILWPQAIAMTPIDQATILVFTKNIEQRRGHSWPARTTIRIGGGDFLIIATFPSPLSKHARVRHI